MGLDTKTYWLTDRQSQCDFDWQEQYRIELSFETPVCQEMNFGAEELNWVGSCRIMARKELDCEKKTSCVIWSDRLLQIRCQDTTSEDWEP
jgi:hypothetical protein